MTNKQKRLNDIRTQGKHIARDASLTTHQRMVQMIALLNEYMSVRASPNTTTSEIK